MLVDLVLVRFILDLQISDIFRPYLKGILLNFTLKNHPLWRIISILRDRQIVAVAGLLACLSFSRLF